MSLAVQLYRLGCLIHWAPRERAIRAMLSRLPDDLRRHARLIDVGSGLGQLSALAQSLGLGYVGLEPDADLRQAAMAAHPSARFEALGAEDLGSVVRDGDIVILNGVAHHLPDPLFESALAHARKGRALVVCDHLLAKGQTHALARWLQSRDQGKFVRPYEKLRALPGFDQSSSEFFPIGPLGLPFWTYFCNVHLPK
jgi:SAM-dependent methyltransferase